jgi:hypothetical protein
MEIIQTIGTILFGLSALGFLLLAVFDTSLGARQQAFATPEAEAGSGIPAAVRLLRASLAKLKLAAAGNRRLREPDENGYPPVRTSQDLEKAA